MLEAKQIIPDETNWLQGYDLSVTAEEKRPFLEKGLELEKSPANLLRERVFSSRYLDKKGRVTGSDKFMKYWQDLAVVKLMGLGAVSERKLKKIVRGVYDGLMLKEAADPDTTDVMLREYINLSRVYIDCCMNDKSYGSIVLGFGSIKESSLAGKIGRDIIETVACVPRAGGMEDDFELLIKGAREGFISVFPEGEEFWDNKILSARI